MCCNIFRDRRRHVGKRKDEGSVTSELVQSVYLQNFVATRRIRQCKSRVGGDLRTGGLRLLAVCQVVLEYCQVISKPFTRSNVRFSLSLSTFWNFPHLLKAKRTHENSHERSLSTWRKFLNLLKSTVRSRPFEIFRLDPHSGTPWSTYSFPSLIPVFCRMYENAFKSVAETKQICSSNGS